MGDDARLAPESIARLKARFDAKRGTLDWYCIDHWSEELGLDIPALKHELREEIRYLDGAAGFLDLLRGLKLRLARRHPDSTDELAALDKAVAQVTYMETM